MDGDIKVWMTWVWRHHPNFLTFRQSHAILRIHYPHPLSTLAGGMAAWGASA